MFTCHRYPLTVENTHARVLWPLFPCSSCASFQSVLRGSSSYDSPPVQTPVCSLHPHRWFGCCSAVQPAKKRSSNAFCLLFPPFPWIGWATPSDMSLCTSLSQTAISLWLLPIEVHCSSQDIQWEESAFPSGCEHFRYPFCILSSLGVQLPSSLHFSRSTFYPTYQEFPIPRPHNVDTSVPC